MDDRDVTEGTHQEEIGHRLPGEDFADAAVLHRLGGAARGILDVVDDRVALGIDRPEGIGHVLEVLVRSVHGEGGIGVLALIDVAAHGLGPVDEEADHVVPGRVVQVIDALLHLGVVLVELGRREAVLGRTVQEFLAGSGGQDESGKGEIFQNVLHICFLRIRK